MFATIPENNSFSSRRFKLGKSFIALVQEFFIVTFDKERERERERKCLEQVKNLLQVFYLHKRTAHNECTMLYLLTEEKDFTDKFGQEKSALGTTG